MMITFRSPPRSWLPGLLLFILAAAAPMSACDKLSCNGGSERETPQRTERWTENTRLAQFIPRTSRTVVFSRNLTTMTEALDFVSTRLPRPGLAAAADEWASTSGLDSLDDDALSRLGLAADQPAALYYDRGFWTLAAGVRAPEDLQRGLDQAARSAGIDARQSTFGSMALRELSLTDTTPQVADTVLVAHDDRSVIVSVRVEDSALHADASTLPEAWQPNSSRSRFVDDAQHRQLLRELSPSGELLGVVRPAAWLADRRADGQAGVLLERILDQVGPVGVAASSVSLDESARLRLLTPGNPRAPTMITSLGQAEGDPPSAAGLIAPGVLGVMRLSVGPRQLYDLLATALPAEQRREIGAFWDELDRELRIHAQRDVLDNLQGHAVVVAYGLDRDALEASDAPWYLDVAKLEATREAVLLPIKEREPLEQVLNGLTTVSKGKLTRQKVGDTLQYAWIEDGRMDWAVILSDESLIYVDSSVAFEHAVEYERGAGSLGEQAEEAGITRVFDEDDSAGMYLDTASLANMLAEADDAAATAWLAPFRTVVATTREEEGTGVTDIDLTIAPPR